MILDHLNPLKKVLYHVKSGKREGPGYNGKINNCRTINYFLAWGVRLYIHFLTVIYIYIPRYLFDFFGDLAGCDDLSIFT